MSRRGGSLESQHEICGHVYGTKKEHGWTETAFFTDTKSGESLDRPGLQAMMDAIRRGEIDVVVVYKLDRLSRSVRDFYEFWEFLKAHSVEFFSATESFDTATPSGRFFLNLMMVFAEFERERIAERTADKRSQRAQRGLWSGGVIPFGYDSASGKLVPREEEAGIVRRVFQDVADGVAASEVARNLRHQGVRTRIREQKTQEGAAKTVGGKWFNTDTVKAMVRNPVYKGCVTHNGAELPGEHQAIVPVDLWERANRRMTPDEQPTRRRAEEDKHGHLLKGLLRCGHCGTALTPHPAGKRDPQGRPYLFYVCTNVTKDGAESPCGVRNLPARPIEDLVLSLLAEMGKHPQVIEDTIGALRRNVVRDVKPLNEELKKLELQHRTVTDRIAALVALAGSDKAGRFGEKLLDEANGLTEQQGHFDAEIARLGVQIGAKEIGVIDTEAVAQQLRDFGTVMNALEGDEQKELVRLMVKEVVVNRFDPEKEKLPAGKAVFPIKIRTQWFSVNITFFATELFSSILQTGVNQFVSKQEWLPRLGSNQRPSD